MSTTGLIGLFFFRDDSGNITNFTKENYLKMLQEFAIRELQKRNDFRDVFFQQDGVPPHYAKIVREFLNANFPDRWLDPRSPLVLRSSDLIACDFFLWGILKVKYIKVNPEI